MLILKSMCFLHVENTCYFYKIRLEEFSQLKHWIFIFLGSKTMIFLGFFKIFYKFFFFFFNYQNKAKLIGTKMLIEFFLKKNWQKNF